MEGEWRNVPYDVVWSGGCEDGEVWHFEYLVSGKS